MEIEGAKIVVENGSKAVRILTALFTPPPPPPNP